jgi:hypothetical protein
MEPISASFTLHLSCYYLVLFVGLEIRQEFPRRGVLVAVAARQKLGAEDYLALAAATRQVQYYK